MHFLLRGKHSRLNDPTKYAQRYICRKVLPIYASCIAVTINMLLFEPRLNQFLNQIPLISTSHLEHSIKGTDVWWTVCSGMCVHVPWDWNVKRGLAGSMHLGQDQNHLEVVRLGHQGG